MNFVVVLIAVVSALAGALVSLFICRAKVAALQQRKDVAEQEFLSARATGERQTVEIRALTEARSALDATLNAERRSTEEKLRLLQDASEQLKSQFKALASSALESNN